MLTPDPSSPPEEKPTKLGCLRDSQLSQDNLDS